jgi:hypothetical protein
MQDDSLMIRYGSSQQRPNVASKHGVGKKQKQNLCISMLYTLCQLQNQAVCAIFFSQQRCAFEKRFLQTHFHGNLVRNASSSSSIHATQNPEINADPSMP